MPWELPGSDPQPRAVRWELLSDFSTASCQALAEQISVTASYKRGAVGGKRGTICPRSGLFWWV